MSERTKVIIDESLPKPYEPVSEKAMDDYFAALNFKTEQFCKDLDWCDERKN